MTTRAECTTEVSSHKLIEMILRSHLLRRRLRAKIQTISMTAMMVMEMEEMVTVSMMATIVKMMEKIAKMMEMMAKMMETMAKMMETMAKMMETMTKMMETMTKMMETITMMEMTQPSKL